MDTYTHPHWKKFVGHAPTPSVMAFSRKVISFNVTGQSIKRGIKFGISVAGQSVDAAQPQQMLGCAITLEHMVHRVYGVAGEFEILSDPSKYGGLSIYGHMLQHRNGKNSIEIMLWH